MKAVQLLFQLNFTYKDYAPLLPREREALTQLYIFGREELDPYAKRIYYGVIEQLDELDQWISRFAEHWKIDRMAKVDLTLLRLGVYELFYCPDVPTASVINEAIELAKMFGEEDSPAFINGILDKISKSRDSGGGMQMEPALAESS
ncbi:MAG: transcription antitermination factor NusB [Deltaproteobacteria bacterium]|nr:transcription antitermination factor NusB [Deltaproteobacteria bacterium]